MDKSQSLDFLRKDLDSIRELDVIDSTNEIRKFSRDFFESCCEEGWERERSMNLESIGEKERKDSFGRKNTRRVRAILP